MPAPTLPQRRLAAGALAALAALAACATARSEPELSDPAPAVAAAPPAAAHPHAAAAAAEDAHPYASAADGRALAEVVARDLEHHRADLAYERLDDLVAWSIVRRESSALLARLREANVHALFLHFGGGRYVAPVATLLGLCERAAARELDAAYQSLRFQDPAGLEAALAPDRALCDAVLASLPERRPHADLVRGVLAVEALRAGRAGSADPALAHLASAAEGFTRAELAHEFFLSRVYAAEALELAGRREEAIEPWLEASESAFFESAPRDVRLVIAGRVQSHRERLRAEVEAEVEAEWQARHARALERVQALEQELEVARRRHAEEIEAAERAHAERLDQERGESEAALAAARAEHARELEAARDEIERQRERTVQVAIEAAGASAASAAQAAALAAESAAAARAAAEPSFGAALAADVASEALVELLVWHREQPAAR